MASLVQMVHARPRRPTAVNYWDGYFEDLSEQIVAAFPGSHSEERDLVGVPVPRDHERHNKITIDAGVERWRPSIGGAA
jgi:hypothetical protein